MISQYVASEIFGDDSYKQADEDLIKDTYEDAAPETQKAIDEIFTALCGWRLVAIIEHAYQKDIGEESDGI